MLAAYVDTLIALGSPLSGLGILIAFSIGLGVPIAATSGALNAVLRLVRSGAPKR